MSSAGHVLDALNRMRFNNSQRKSPNTYLNKEKYFELAYGKVNHGRVYAKDISKEELDRIRKVVREKIRKERKRQFVLTIITFSIVAPIFIFYVIKVLTKSNFTNR